nr:hypothetical protein CFP56_74559 [Quercus suber]
MGSNKIRSLTLLSPERTKLSKSNIILENVFKQGLQNENLKMIESISRFTTLRHLSISNCKKLREIPRLPQSIRSVSASNCDRLDTQSSSRLLIQFREILAILPNTVAEAATRFGPKWPMGHLTLPVTEIPKWLKFNHHQSVGNSVSFLVGPKFSNLVVSIAFPSKDLPNYLDNIRWQFWSVQISINGKTNLLYCSPGWEKSNYDHLWLMYWKVNLSNPSEENRIEVEVIPGKGISNISLNRMKIYVECICCPQKPNIWINVLSKMGKKIRAVLESDADSEEETIDSR